MSIYTKYRRKAVTDLDDLIVGNTYYTNHVVGEIKVLGLLTNEEAYQLILGVGYDGSGDPDSIEWIYYSSGVVPRSELGMTVFPYNHILLFENKNDRDEYVKEMDMGDKLENYDAGPVRAMMISEMDSDDLLDELENVVASHRRDNDLYHEIRQEIRSRMAR